MTEYRIAIDLVRYHITLQRVETPDADHIVLAVPSVHEVALRDLMVSAAGDDAYHVRSLASTIRWSLDAAPRQRVLSRRHQGDRLRGRWEP
jgi:hypothetical protein